MKEGNQVRQQDLVALALEIRRSAIANTNVADVYIVESITDEAIICHSINNVDEKIFCIKSRTVNVGDVVLVLFTGHEFKINLKRYIETGSIQKIENSNDHVKSNAIIIERLYSGGSQNAN